MQIRVCIGLAPKGLLFPIPVHFCHTDVTFNTFYRHTVLIFDYKFLSLRWRLLFDTDLIWWWWRVTLNWDIVPFIVFCSRLHWLSGTRFCTLTILFCYGVNLKVLVCASWSELQYFYVALTFSICLCAMNISGDSVSGRFYPIKCKVLKQ